MRMGSIFTSRIRIDPDEKLLILSTYGLADDGDRREAESRVNAANARTGLVQFHFAQSRIWGRHWISYADSLNVRQLIKTMRRFSTSFIEAVEPFNTKRGVLAPAVGARRKPHSAAGQ